MPKYYVTGDFEGIEYGRVSAHVEASCISEAIALVESRNVDWDYRVDDSETKSITNIKIIGDE